MNRQIFYLHPDPARVVVRPFKPARLNPETSTQPIRLGPTILSAEFFSSMQQLPRNN